jgi:hypothetical protein
LQQLPPSSCCLIRADWHNGFRKWQNALKLLKHIDLIDLLIR